ncbi:MFS transporter [Cryptosporangium aurantiacum]|uniref:Drug resistance transporter, EmrB/QacA subfamily n=1 Tax=Cryptosporangium aurantiacum TaxID=134849 RepID=A0A1M7MRE8_9ACTN|nr:MFS transporter [Cryptosporangium aurantiacum]SHM93569.1 drug resistance transporter, EmrB/QacA subfamily [Cryptosporangium aurantiacum]
MRKWMPLIAISLGTFMLLIDVTIVNVALPDIAADLHTGLGDLQWVIDIYALALAALLLGVGSAADRFGRKRVYLIGMTLFAIASLGCALADSSTTLIVARGIQGIGGAAMFATTIALINTAYTGKDRGIAFGIWGAINGAATAAGPILGGLLTEHYGWPSIFLVNVPIGVLTVVLAMRVLAESNDPAARIDPAGVVTFTLAASAATYGLIRAGEDGWTAPAALIAFGFGFAALAVFIVVERARAYPMLDLSLFKRPAFTGLMVAAVAINLSAFSVMAFTSLWLQSVLGLSPIAAGAVFVPLSLASLVCSVLAGRLLHDRVAPGLIIGGGLVLISAGSALQALVGSGSSWTVLVPGLIVMGIGVGTVMPTLSSAALAAAPRERSGMAGGAVTTFRQLGLVLGIAVLGGVFAGRVENTVRDEVPDAHRVAELLTGGQARVVTGTAPAEQRSAIDDLVHTAFASGLRWSFLLCAAVALIGAVLTLVLTQRRSAPAAEQAVPAPVG